MPTNAAGDMIYVMIAATRVNTSPAGSYTDGTPSGWTEIFDGSFGGASAVALGVFRKQSTGSEASTYTWTIAPGSDFAAIAASYRNAKEVPDVVSGPGLNIGATASPISPDVTTTVANTMVLRIFGADDDDANATSYPTGLNGRDWLEFGDTGPGHNGLSIGLADLAQAAVGATGTATWSLAGTEDWGAVTIALAPTDVTVSSAGTQTSSLLIPSTDQYVGGTLVISDNGNGRNVTGITITEKGTVTANTNLSNVRLYYETAADCSAQTFSGFPTPTESLFGSATTFNGADGSASFTGSVAISTASEMCVYAVVDVGAGATDNQTLEIEISDPSSDITFSVAPSIATAAVALAGTTNLDTPPDLQQIHYRWRNDDGGEASPLFDSDAALCLVNAGGPLAQAGNTYNTTGTAHNVWTDGTYIYAADGASGLHAFTFDGTNFTLVDTYDSAGTAYDVLGDGTYIYLADGSSGIHGLSFNGVSFTYIASATPGGSVEGLAGDGTYIYFGNNSGHFAYSFNGTSFTQAGTNGHWLNEAVFVDDGGVMHGSDRGGNPDILRAKTFNGSTFTQTDSQDAVGDDVVDLFGDANYIYSAETASGVVAYTYSGTYTKKTTYNSPGSAQGIWADGVYAYLADGASGIRVLKFNDPAWISVSSIDVTTNSANGIWGDGTYIYAAEGTDGIRAYSGFACTSVSGTSGATWAANEDTALSGLDQEKTKRLRLEVSNEGGQTSSGVTYQLQYATSTSGPWTSLPDANWVMAASSYLTEGAATTDFTGSLGNANPTFVAGQVRDVASATSGITLTPSDFTELEYSVQATATAADDTYYFRVLNGADTTYFNYQVYPQVTLGGDVTAPLLASATVNGTSLVLTYTEINGLDTTSTPANGDFTVGGQTVTGVVVAANTVTLTLSPGVANGDTVTISYTQVVGREIEDEAQNKAVNLSSQAVTNNTPDTTVPVFSSAAVNGTSLVLTYTEINGLVTTSTPANGAFSIGTTGVAQSVTGVVVASGTVTLTLSPGVSGLDTITVSYTASTEPIRDAALNLAADLNLAAVTNNTPAAVLTGTLADNAIESEIVAGTETLVITLTNDTWHANIGSTSAETTALINGIDSAQGETKGWDLVVKAGLNDTHVVRNTDTQVTITLPAFSTYDITANETISVLVPAAALVTSGSDVGAETNFNVVYQSATLSGTLSDNAVETELRSSGQTLVITLVNDTWHGNVGSASAETTALIAGLDSGQGETLGWDLVVKAGLNNTHVVQTTSTVVTITLPAFSTYDITAQETITVTVPAAALVSSGSDLDAATTFNTTVATGSAALTGSVTNDNEEDIRTGTSDIVLTLTDDSWLASGAGGGFPQVQSVTETSFPTDPQSHLVQMPATVDPGDLLIMLVAFDNEPPSATPGGWSELFKTTNSAAEFAAYAKDAVGDEDGTTVDVTTGIGVSGSAQVYRITNWEGTLANGVEVGTSATGGTANPDSPSLTASWGGQANNLWLAVAGAADDDQAVTTPYPANYTTPIDTISGAGTDSSAQVYSASRENAVDAENPPTFTIASTESWVANTIVIRPTPPSFEGERQNIINGLDSGGTDPLGWDNVVKAGINVTDVVRTSDTVVTITLPAFGSYDPLTNETITATVPASALVQQSGSDLTASPTFNVLAFTAALSGTLADNATETELRSSGQTLVITLTNDTWHTNVGSPSTETTALINGLDSAQGETKGWDAVVKAGLNDTHVVRTSPTVVTITLPAFSTYDISAQETITVTVPAAALVTSTTDVDAGTFNTTVVAGSVALTGSVTNDTDADIRAGTSDIVLTLTDDTWHANIGSASAETTALITNLDSDGTETLGWDAVVKAGLNDTHVVRDTDTQVTITLPAFSTYDLTANETITATVPASALVQSGSAIGATPTFAITAPTDLQQVHYRWRDDDGKESAFDAGTGADGSVTISTSQNINTAILGSNRSTNADGILTTVTANPTGTSITVASTTGIAAGDEIFLINLQGVEGDTADVGNYEFLTVDTVPDSTTINVKTAIANSYDGTTFSAQKIVVQRVPQWTSVTINSSGILNANAWSGTSGGIVVFRANGTVTINGTGKINVTGLGYKGGAGGISGGDGGGINGESYDGALVGKGGQHQGQGTKGGGGGSEYIGTLSPANRGGGGGGGETCNCVGYGGAGGGGYGGGGGGGAGGTDSSGYDSTDGGLAGATRDNTDALAGGGGGGEDSNDGTVGGASGTKAVPAGQAGGGTWGGAAAVSGLATGTGGRADNNSDGPGGGGGGGESADHTGDGEDGGAGGGIIFIIADTVDNNAADGIRTEGNAGDSTVDGDAAGGGGAGGSLMIHANTFDNTGGTVTAYGGAGGAKNSSLHGGGGGAGGVGRIRIEADTINQGTMTPPPGSTAVTPSNGSGGTWTTVNEDTALTGLARLTTKRVRFEIANSGVSAGNVLYRLEVSQKDPTSCDAGGNTWTRVDSSTEWNMVASTHFGDGDSTSNVNPGLTDAYPTFKAGQLKESTDETSGIDLNGAEFTEIEYAIQATPQSSGGSTYCFRLSAAANPTDFSYTETKYAKVTLANAGQNFYHISPAAEFATTSSTWTGVSSCSLAFTPGSTSETWLVTASGQVRSSSLVDTETGFVRMRVEGTVEGEAGVQSDPADGETGFFMMQRITGTTGQQDIDVQAQDPHGNGSTTTVEQCSITALRIPANADFQWTEVDGTAGNCLDTPDTTVLTHQFTPSSTGDYLSIVSFAATERPAGAGLTSWITYPSGAVAPDFHSSNMWMNDRFFLSSLVSMREENLAASQQTLSLTCNGSSGGSSIYWAKAASFRMDAFGADYHDEDLTEVTGITSSTWATHSTVTQSAPAASSEFLMLGTISGCDQEFTTSGPEHGMRFREDSTVQGDSVYGVLKGCTNAGSIHNSLQWVEPYTTASAKTWDNQYQSTDGTTEARFAESAIHVLQFYATSAAISSTNPASLTESNLNSATVTVDLTNGLYDGSLVNGDFSLNGAPTGTTISGVVRDSDTQATLTLAYDSTDFDTNASMSVTVATTALVEGGPVTTGTVTVTAEGRGDPGH